MFPSVKVCGGVCLFVILLLQSNVCMGLSQDWVSAAIQDLRSSRSTKSLSRAMVKARRGRSLELLCDRQWVGQQFPEACLQLLADVNLGSDLNSRFKDDLLKKLEIRCSTGKFLNHTIKVAQNLRLSKACRRKIQTHNGDLNYIEGASTYSTQP